MSTHDVAHTLMTRANAMSRRGALRGMGGLAALAAGMATQVSGWAAAGPGVRKEISMAQIGVDALTGSWTYRSLVNDPTPGVPFNDLAFAEAELVIDTFEPGSFNGRLVLGAAAELTLVGASSFGNPFTVRFQGRGANPGIQDFVYDYVGYLAPVWPNGIEQRPALVGSIVRTEPHSGGAEPGFVASWIAVKRD